MSGDLSYPTRKKLYHPTYNQETGLGTLLGSEGLRIYAPVNATLNVSLLPGTSILTFFSKKQNQWSSLAMQPIAQEGEDREIAAAQPIGVALGELHWSMSLGDSNVDPNSLYQLAQEENEPILDPESPAPSGEGGVVLVFGGLAVGALLLWGLSQGKKR